MVIKEVMACRRADRSDCGGMRRSCTVKSRKLCMGMEATSYSTELDQYAMLLQDPMQASTYFLGSGISSNEMRRSRVRGKMRGMNHAVGWTTQTIG